MNDKAIANVGIVVFSVVLVAGLATYFNIGSTVAKTLQTEPSYPQDWDNVPDSLSVATVDVKKEGADTWDVNTAEVGEKFKVKITVHKPTILDGVPIWLAEVYKDSFDSGVADILYHRPTDGTMGSAKVLYTTVKFDEPGEHYIISRVGWAPVGFSGTRPSYDFDYEKVTVNPVMSGTTYALETSVIGQGNVSLNPPGGEYVKGEEVEIRAIPSTRWEFNCWIGDVTSSDNKLTTVIMDSDKSVTAVFRLPNYAVLNVNLDGSGTVSRAGSKGQAPFTVPEGETIRLKAFPSEGYTFDRWTGARSSPDKVVEVLMNSDKSITAHFKEKRPISKKYSLIASLIGTIGLIGSIRGRFLL